MPYNGTSPLENYVKSYLKQNNRQSLPTIYVKKAIALVNQKLADPCCSGVTGSTFLYTKKDNTLTIFVQYILNSMTRAGYVSSLNRTKKALQNFIGIPCCSNLTLTNPSTGTAAFSFKPNYTSDVNSYSVSLFNASTNVKFGSTVIFNSNLNQDTLSGSFTSVPSGSYYINLVTNFKYNRPSELIKSKTITIN